MRHEMELSLSTGENTMEHDIFDDKIQKSFLVLGNSAEQIRMCTGTHPAPPGRTRWNT